MPALSRARCIPEELEEVTSNPRFDELESGFRESRPMWDGGTAGREDLGLVRTVPRHPKRPGHSCLPAHVA